MLPPRTGYQELQDYRSRNGSLRSPGQVTLSSYYQTLVCIHFAPNAKANGHLKPTII